MAPVLAAMARLADAYRRVISSLCCRASANDASRYEARLRLTLNACRVTIFSSRLSEANGPTALTAAHAAITDAIRAAGAAPASRNRQAATAIRGRTRYSIRNWFSNRK